jgi:hypothetical protein
MIRNRPRVLWPELPFSRTSREEDWAMMAKGKEQSPEIQKKHMKTREELGRTANGWSPG